MKPVSLIWGFGPTYRRRIGHNIEKALSTGYDDILEYIVLTDNVDDFWKGISKQVKNKIVSVTDINKARESFLWSFNEEMVPTGDSEEEYGKNYVDGMQKGRMFSYSIHRFSLLELQRLGVTKFVIQDNDVDIRYDKIVNGIVTEADFWKEFDTPESSMKGCHKETVMIDNSGAILEAMAIGHNSNDVFKISEIVFEHLNKVYGTKRTYDKHYFNITEGPFRFYNFKSVLDLGVYFETWNEILRLSYITPSIRTNMSCGGYMLCDFIPVGIANNYNGIEVLDFSSNFFKTNIYYADRYFMPRGTGFADGLCFWPAPTVAEFMINNAKVVDWLKNRNEWLE